MGLRLLISTAPAEAAPGIARALVEEKLAACVNVVERVRSVYSWKGAICDDAEALLLVKTTADRVAELAARLKALHPYEVPEIVSIEIREGEGNPEYLEWIAACVRETLL